MTRPALEPAAIDPGVSLAEYIDRAFLRETIEQAGLTDGLASFALSKVWCGVTKPGFGEARRVVGRGVARRGPG